MGIAWQVAFVVIGSDPARFRPMMIPAVLEKFIFVLSLGALILGILFIVSFVKVDADRNRSHPV